MSSLGGPIVHLLDYGAGNVRSIRNALAAAGFRVEDISNPSQLADARVVVFPGVGAFGSAMKFLDDAGFRGPLIAYIKSGRPYMGMCLGMQTLFKSSDESPGVVGLGIIPGAVTRFPSSASFSVPHMGWNGLRSPGSVAAGGSSSASSGGGASSALAADSDPLAHPSLQRARPDTRFYFVHSYRALLTPENKAWALTVTDYGGAPFISSVARGALFATQFHPEKSAEAGIDMFRGFLSGCFNEKLTTMVGAAAAAAAPSLALSASGGGGEGEGASTVKHGGESVNSSSSSSSSTTSSSLSSSTSAPVTVLARRIVACLDVRTNDEGDLVVTKGDQYDVREKAPPTPLNEAGAPSSDASSSSASGSSSSNSSSSAASPSRTAVRNLGKPVDLAARYYTEGADEIVFLNITAYRGEPLEDSPMLAVLEAASARVYVPLTIGGGIRAYSDASARSYSALDVASRYFRAGADKVSIGSDAVLAAEDYYARNGVLDGSTAIESIAKVYGSQAVVVSIDPKRVYVDSADDPEAKAAGHYILRPKKRGPLGQEFAWYQCTIKGGREGRPLCATRFAKAVEALGAGELLVNCVDNDGQKEGFDEELLGSICASVRIPVIASSGAGRVEHFSTIFHKTRVEAALAAGIFHRKEVEIADVKRHLLAEGIVPR